MSSAAPWRGRLGDVFCEGATEGFRPGWTIQHHRRLEDKLEKMPVLHMGCVGGPGG